MSDELIVSEESVIRKIYFLRSKNVMLDSDLADLYDVTTSNLNKAVGRNKDRFPEDFMFELTKEEWENLKSQNVTSNWGGRRKLPKVFTEQGVAMLSGVLNSKRAIMVNIQIMRAYSRMRELLLTHKDLLRKMDEMEKKLSGQDENIRKIFAFLKQFIKEKEIPRKQIGFKKSKKKE